MHSDGVRRSSDGFKASYCTLSSLASISTTSVSTSSILALEHKTDDGYFIKLFWLDIRILMNGTESNNLTADFIRSTLHIYSKLFENKNVHNITVAY